MQDILIFANPIAGRGRGRPTAGRLAERLTRDGYRTRVFLSRADELEALDLCNLSDVRAAVVIGGDGTLRTVASRLYEACGKAPPPLLVVPMGTANLMGVHLGLRWDDRTLEGQVSDAVARCNVLQLDAAVANDRLFLLMAGVGIDAKVVHELDRIRSGPISLASYAVPAALAFSMYRYPPITVEVDGKVVFADRPAVAMVGNIREYGTRFPILPHARPDDGLLDVCAMPCSSPQELIPLFLHAAAGEHLQLEGVVYAKGKHVRITSAEQVPVQIDGDPGGFTPLAVDLLPTRIPFIVP